MKKRRVLALFLALSMTLSSNAFTVLAAEKDPGFTVEANSLEETDESGISEESGEAGNEGGVSEENADAESGNDVLDESDNAETGNENDASDESGETETGDNASGESGESEIGDNTSGESDGTENESDTSDETDISDETMPADDVQTDIEQVEGSEAAVPRMRTFIDETGMSVTYDTNAEASYIYIVEDGVLISVTNAGGTLSGTVELKQQEGDKAYHTIGEDVFKDNKDIEYVILPSGVKFIDQNAFSGCTKLRGISLPVKLESIGDGAFKGCTNMTQLSVPKAVKSIGDSAFEGDASLFMVYIKDSSYSDMTIIGEAAFKDCRHLEKFGSDTEFILPGRLESIGASAFENCIAIKKVTLPDSVVEKEIKEKNPDTGEEKITIQEALGGNVFKNCAGLTDVILSGAKLIPEHAFDGCTSLLSVTFANGNETIDEYAFANCSRLSEIIFSYSLIKVNDYAFSGCSQLRYVEFPNPKVEIGDNGALPNNNSSKLWVRGFVGTDLEAYVKKHNNMQFIAFKSNSTETFQYTYKCLTTSAIGNVKFYQSDKTTVATEKQSFKVGEKIYIFVTSTASAKLVDGSLRCNGTPIGKDSDGDYVFKMPVGGAYITAEFENTKVNQNGDRIPGNITYELSNGSELKVGQTTRMFLIDTSVAADNSVIPDSEVTFTSNNKKVATVSAHNGTIRAVGIGTAYITATLYDGNGNKVVAREAAIQVETADVDSLRLKPYTYDTILMTEEKDSHGVVTGINLSKKDIESRGSLTFTLLATAYDSNGDNMSVALKWSTSDSKIAKLAKTSTKDTEPQNTITIPSGASGEAAITVKATNANPIDPNNKTVTTKFIIRVMDSEPRLSTSTITLNPYMEEGVSIEVISAYEARVDEDNVKLNRYDDKSEPSRNFKLTYVETSDNDSPIIKFKINAVDTDLEDGTYKECVYIDVADNEYYLTLNINVKKSIPVPKVKFANKEKINLFYLGDATEITPVISNLGNAKIKSYDLEDLSNSVDDSYFTKNFDIDQETGVITRSYENMYYTSKKKPVVTGYLVLKFAGYKDGVNEKKIKITIPTTTTKPSYKLERTSDTFSIAAGTQAVELYLLDSKTKQPIEMDSNDWKVELDAASTSSAVSSSSVGISEYGGIKMDVNPIGDSGKVVLKVSNSNWDASQVLKFNYSVKISDKKPTFKLSKSSVSLNRFFAGTQIVSVSLKSNQYGIEPTNTDFEAPDLEKLSETKADSYSKINISWNSVDNTVEVRLTDPDIKNGSYKFTCYPLGDDGNKVTLTVKVTAAAPSLSLKGSATLNLAAGTETDTAELAIKVKNLPSDCELDTVATASSIEYDTNKEDDDLAGIESSFNCVIENNKLKISLGSTEIAARTYTFRMTPAYTGYSLGENDKEKQVKFKVKVYRKNISVSLKAKGKLNLLDRYDGIYSAADDLEGNNVSATMSLANTSKPNTAAPISLSALDKDIALDAVYDDVIPSLEGSVDGGQNSDSEEGTAIPVRYVYDDKNITIKLNSEEENEEVEEKEENEVEESNVIIIDPDNNKPVKEYVYKAAVIKGHDYKITSINAYKTDDPENGEVGDNDEPIAEGGGTEEGDAILDGKSATLTIGTNIDFTGVDGIIIVVKAEPTSAVKPGDGEGDTDDPTEEPTEPTKYVITLSKPDIGVSNLEYAVIGSDEDLDSLKDEDIFEDYEEAVPVTAEEKFAFKITPTGGYSIVSVTASTVVEPLDPVEVKENVYLLKDITADTSVDIKVRYDNAQEITFVQNSIHSKIRKNADDESEIVKGLSTADGYSFVIVKDEGYDVKVELYATEEYEDGDNDGTLEPESLTPSKDENNVATYTIAASEITEAITIVVTDIYTVIINNDNSNITELEYKVNNDEEYSSYYKDDKLNKPKLEYGETLSLKFKVEDLEDNQNVVVKVVSGEDKSEPELTPTEDNLYTCSIGEITDNTEITILIVTTFTVKSPDMETIPDKVESLKYVVIDGSEIGEDVQCETFDYESFDGDDITIVGGKSLVLEVTLKDKNYVVESIKCNAGELELTLIKVKGSVFYYLLEIDTDIASFEISLAEVYAVNFVKNGTHSVITDDNGQEIEDNADSAEKNKDYTFTVNTDTGYGVEVMAYTADSYYNADESDEPDLEEITCTPEADNVYRIPANEIAGDIVIVVTDLYTVTIDNITAGNISGLSYKLDASAEFDSSYSSEETLTVAHGKNFYFTFTPAAGKTIVVFDDFENRHQLSPDGVESAEAPVYTLEGITDNVTITIAVKYAITAEITQDNKGADTASITYGNNVITDSSGCSILSGNDLTFTVQPNKGYTVSKTEYKRVTEETGKELTSESNSDAGVRDYTIAGEDIIDNIVITVTTELLDSENYTVEFDVDGVSVKVGEREATPTPAAVKIPVNAEGADRSFTFSVTPETGKILRHVKTDSWAEITEPDENGIYTFTLSADPAPVTTIYISATTKAPDIKVNFTGLVDETVKKASVSTVTFSEDLTKITTTPLLDTGYAAASYVKGDKVHFMISSLTEGYKLYGVYIDEAEIKPETSLVIVDGETEARNVDIYTLDLANVDTDEITIRLSVALPSEDDEPEYKYNLKNCIVYTPVVSNLKDTVVEAQIYDASDIAPSYDSNESAYFNIDVANGLLYVTPKEDLDDEVYLKNNTIYPVKIWVKFERYDSGLDGGGLWVNKIIKIKTAQTLPKVITNTKTLNLYQSNTAYTATFVVTLKEGSVGKLEDIEFGEKDEKARESFDIDSEVQNDGSLKVTLSLNDGSRYAANSTNKVNMYVKFKNQAVGTTGTAITMNVKINR